MKFNIKKQIKSYLVVTAGTVILTLGVYFFKIPNNFSTGGVSGISIILGKLFPVISSGTYIAAINVVLLVFGFAFLGKSFGVKTVYSSLLFSALSIVLEKIIPMERPFTDEPLLELVFAMLLPAVGSALLFNQGASSGGTDITAMILRKYTDLDIGKALFACDSVVAVSTFFVFGIKTGLFCILGLVLKALVVDNVIENITICKFFIIVTDKSEPICNYIINQMHHGVTISDAVGGYTENGKKLLYTACRRREALALKNEVKSIDSHAFIFITNTSEIIGRGFR